MAEPLSRRDLDFLLHDWLDVTALTSRERFADHSRETFDSVMDVSQDMALEFFAPHNKLGDQQAPYVGEDGKVVLIDEALPALEEFARAGLISCSFDESLGGIQLPVVMTRAALAWFQAANPGTSAYPMLGCPPTLAANATALPSPDMSASGIGPSGRDAPATAS